MAGAFLVTPGILTDIFGFLCLIPTTRRFIKRAIRRRIDRAIQSGRVVTGRYGGPAPRARPTPDDVVIIDHDDIQ